MSPGSHGIVPVVTSYPLKERFARNQDRRNRIWIFGNFGSTNFGNEITFRTAFLAIRRWRPNSDVGCVCTDPKRLADDIKQKMNIDLECVALSGPTLRRRGWRFWLTRRLWELLVWPPLELYRWFVAFLLLKKTSMLIIAGTGLVTDSYCLEAWGVWNQFKWVFLAKLRGCKVALISVGVGPVTTRRGKWLARTVLRLAHFCSFRDQASLDCARQIGGAGTVYPDLVFSFPTNLLPKSTSWASDRPVVALGIMQSAGTYGTEGSNGAVRPYMERLAIFAGWLIDNGYRVRILTGDELDLPCVDQFLPLLLNRRGQQVLEYIISEPARSVDDLLDQIASVDLVVGTRFHNLVLAFMLRKPVIAISFHHKCSELMRLMGMSEYSEEIGSLDTGRLVERFQKARANALVLKATIDERLERARDSLEEQYRALFGNTTKPLLGSVV
jgi:polysaccharide pyruvyl transferase WcaK-like protein